MNLWVLSTHSRNADHTAEDLLDGEPSVSKCRTEPDHRGRFAANMLALARDNGNLVEPYRRRDLDSLVPCDPTATQPGCSYQAGSSVNQGARHRVRGCAPRGFGVQARSRREPVPRETSCACRNGGHARPDALGRAARRCAVLRPDAAPRRRRVPLGFVASAGLRRRNGASQADDRGLPQRGAGRRDGGRTRRAHPVGVRSHAGAHQARAARSSLDGDLSPRRPLQLRFVPPARHVRPARMVDPRTARSTSRT